jgi:dihydroorotase
VVLIKGGFVFDYRNHLNGQVLDIRIEDSRIADMRRQIKPSDNEKVIDAEGLYVIPGVVDMHCHLREPGGEHKETVKSGTAAAAKGGITTILAMPNTTPALDNPHVLYRLQSIIKKDAKIEVKAASAMTRNREGFEPVNFAQNKQAGFAAFSDDGDGVGKEHLLYDICYQAKNCGALLIEHPEDVFLSKKEPCSYGKVADILKTMGQPAESESLDILKFGTIAGMIGARAHFTHISTRKSVEAIRMLKRLYPGFITADTTPHHLRLSEDDNLLLDPNLKMHPPLRPEDDRIAVERGVIFGTIDAIASDHAPHSVEEKELGFMKAPFGVIGFETMLSIVFTHLVKQHRTSMLDMVKLLCANPAKILRLEEGGAIQEGRRADITIFDPDKRWTVKQSGFVSMSKNSAFIDKEVWGWVRVTVSKGEIVYEA